MIQTNKNYNTLNKYAKNNVFREVSLRTEKYVASNPRLPVIKIGIGDVTRPLPQCVLDAMHNAVNDMGNMATFKGYPPDYGYSWLIEKICQYDFQARGINIEPSEVFISDGCKTDICNVYDILGDGNIVGITDPVYPIYLIADVLVGHAGEYNEQNRTFSNIVYLNSTVENNFSPETPNTHVDLIWICSPNNPTGSVLTLQQLQAWVDYAIANNALIIYDAAYEVFLGDENPDLPHSIYQCQNAKRCCIELRSFSKNGGFTGIRCGYAIVPKEISVADGSLNALWASRTSNKSNGVSYITQRGAEAIFSPEGRQQVQENIQYYKRNARVLFDGLTNLGFACSGGVYSPYVWVKIPAGTTSWEFFDHLLNNFGIVCTPGSGFGACGEGYVRFSGFGTYENTQEAVQRMIDGGLHA